MGEGREPLERELLRRAEAATGGGVSDAGSSGMQLRHLDGLELMRQLWELEKIWSDS